MSPMVHDMPVLGIFTTAFADGFAGVLWSQPTKEQLQEAFDKADTERTGKLDKFGVSEALGALDKSDRQIQRLIDLMAEDEVDFAAFEEMVVPGPRPYTYDVLGGLAWLPNHEKVLDTPVLGPVLLTTNESMAMPCDDTLRSWRSLTFPASDHRMAAIFHEASGKKTGRIGKKEIPEAMRSFYKTEREIKDTLEALKKDISVYEFKKMIRGPKYSPSVVNYIPMLGPALASNLLSAFDDDMPEEDQREAFEFIDKNKSGKLDKTEIAELLRELGKSEMEVQKFMEFIQTDELDFEGFVEFMQNGVTRDFLTTVSGYPVPNPAKIHDVPFVGRATSMTQDICVDAYRWTVGAARKHFTMIEESVVREKFDEFDKKKSGTISKKEAADALRAMGLSEADIKYARESTEKETLNFDDFHGLVKTVRTTGKSATE